MESNNNNTAESQNTTDKTEKKVRLIITVSITDYLHFLRKAQQKEITYAKSKLISKRNGNKLKFLNTMLQKVIL